VLLRYLSTRLGDSGLLLLLERPLLLLRVLLIRQRWEDGLWDRRDIHHRWVLGILELNEERGVLILILNDSRLLRGGYRRGGRFGRLGHGDGERDRRDGINDSVSFLGDLVGEVLDKRRRCWGEFWEEAIEVLENEGLNLGVNVGEVLADKAVERGNLGEDGVEVSSEAGLIDALEESGIDALEGGADVLAVDGVEVPG
jgi:hypothetical protein